MEKQTASAYPVDPAKLAQEIRTLEETIKRLEEAVRTSLQEAIQRRFPDTPYEQILEQHKNRELVESWVADLLRSDTPFTSLCVQLEVLREIKSSINTETFPGMRNSLHPLTPPDAPTS